MRISLNWLNDYIDIKNIPVQSVADSLTDIGLEVETIEKITPIKGEVLVGQVKTAEQHPDADRLRVCQVDVGRDEDLTIVCGAPNARVGIKVSVAMVGSVLPGDFKIKKSKVRGVPSFGMMCAEDELGLSDNHDEIMELAEDLAVGASVIELYHMEDTVLTLGLTPNRADCLGYVGVARDLAAKLGVPLKLPNVNDIELAEKLKSKDHVKIEIEDADDCPRFTGLYIKNVKTVSSPAWLQRRLEAAGMRPINLIVDVTNYAMLESGQPIHAYDERDVRGGRLAVRKAKAGETLKTLDGTEQKLDPQDLLICDGKGPVGLAGVMGGENSEVKEDTSAIIVEVANFHGGRIRKTAKRLALHTEASHRFERGTDTSNCHQVAFRVGQLLQQCATELKSTGVEISVPEVANEIVDVYPAPRRPGVIAIRLSRARQILGLSTLLETQIIDSLESLGFPMLDKTEDSKRLLFQVPQWRCDIEREVDLIEEVGRMIGYDKVPFALPMMEIGPLKENPMIQFIDDCKFSLAQCGLNEIISFPFIGSKDLDQFLIPANHPMRNTVNIKNPLAEDQAYMQTGLIFNLVKAVANNRRRGVRGARLFEAGRGYLAQKTNLEDGYCKTYNELGHHYTFKAKEEERAAEKNLIAGILDQPYVEKNWSQSKDVPAGFYQLKSLLERWLSGFSLANLNFDQACSEELPFLHPSACAYIMANDKIIGYAGELHPKVALTYDLSVEQTPVVFEICLEELIETRGSGLKLEVEIPKFPPVTRDFAFVVDRNLKYSDFRLALDSFQRRKNLKNYRLFDVYEGENVADDKKSVAISFSFQSAKKTLNDKEVEKEIANLKDHLKESLQAELR